MGTAEDDKIPLMLLAPYRMWNDPQSFQGMHMLRAACGHLTWISPQGQAWLLLGQPVRTACLDCRPPNLAELKNYLVPGAREAAARDLSPDEHATWERVLRHYNVKDLPEGDPQ